MPDDFQTYLDSQRRDRLREAGCVPEGPPQPDGSYRWTLPDGRKVQEYEALLWLEKEES